ncbi:MAG: hypothetical protein J6D21_06835 [Clostridia bacterium]|nr:hypothetical protein [Clostridia bacterium]
MFNNWIIFPFHRGVDGAKPLGRKGFEGFFDSVFWDFPFVTKGKITSYFSGTLQYYGGFVATLRRILRTIWERAPSDAMLQKAFSSGEGFLGRRGRQPLQWGASSGGSRGG